jgi:hypothetical protein
MGRKSTSEEPAAPAKEAETAPAPTSETAPVIPPVETTTPLDASVASPATVPTETKEVAPATNGEHKKSDKRKSSIPFLNKKEKAALADDGESPKAEKPSGGFSLGKLRATIRGRKVSAEKKEEDKTEVKPEDKPAEASTSAPAKEEAPKPAEEEPIKPEPVASTAPAVTAAA